MNLSELKLGQTVSAASRGDMNKKIRENRARDVEAFDKKIKKAEDAIANLRAGKKRVIEKYKDLLKS